MCVCVCFIDTEERRNVNTRIIEWSFLDGPDNVIRGRSSPLDTECQLSSFDRTGVPRSAGLELVAFSLSLS